MTDFNIRLFFIINSFIHVTLMYGRLTYVQIYVIYMYRCVKILPFPKLCMCKCFCVVYACQYFHIVRNI